MAGERNNVAAGNFLPVVLVFADLLLGSVKKLRDLLLIFFSPADFLQPAADIHRYAPF